MGRCVYIQLAEDATTTWDAWSILASWFKVTFGSEGVWLCDTPISIHEVQQTLRDSRMEFADISIQGEGGVALGNNRQAGIFMINVVSLPHERESIDEWLQRLPFSGMIVGRVCDGDYERWQNVELIDRYEHARRPHEHLPKVWSEVLEMEVIDTSQNPGRKRHCNGYIEAVGSVMWIGPLFAERTGGDWTKLKQYDWCQIDQQGEIVRIQSWPTPFDSDQGEQRERQEILREVLFPRPCER